MSSSSNSVAVVVVNIGLGFGFGESFAVISVIIVTPLNFIPSSSKIAFVFLFQSFPIKEIMSDFEFLMGFNSTRITTDPNFN